MRVGLRIDEAKRGKLLEHGLHQALVGEQGEPMTCDLGAIVRQPGSLLLDPKNPPARLHLAVDLDLGTDHRIEQIGRRVDGLGAERQVAEQLLQRRLAGQGHSAKRAFTVEHREAFEDIVDLIEPDRKLQLVAGGCRAGVGELREPRVRYDHPLQRQLGGYGNHCARGKGRARTR